MQVLYFTVGAEG